MDSQVRQLIEPARYQTASNVATVENESLDGLSMTNKQHQLNGESFQWWYACKYGEVVQMSAQERAHVNNIENKTPNTKLLDYQ